MKSIIGMQQTSQLLACLLGLTVSLRGKFHSVIGGRLVNIAVLVSLRLRMADKNNHLT